ncbi:MAG: VOC family protein [Porphyrobacter sp.]|nr:VOC family protein [Porphyrobacter sp.]
MSWKVGYVTIGVRDLERAIEFYRDTLGLPLLYAAPEFHYAAFDAGGTRLSLASGGGESSIMHGLPHGNTGIGLVVPDVDAAYRELSAKGVEFTMAPQKQPWGGYMGMFADPDGNVFYLDGAA